MKEDAADAGTDGSADEGMIPRAALAKLACPGLISFTPLGYCAARQWGRAARRPGKQGSIVGIDLAEKVRFGSIFQIS